MTKFTEFEIVTLWNHFKSDFPSGDVNQSQLSQMIKKTFPKYYDKYLHIILLDQILGANILKLYHQIYSGLRSAIPLYACFEIKIKRWLPFILIIASRVFDQDRNGTIRFHELLLAFSMSMRGSGF